MSVLHEQLITQLKSFLSNSDVVLSQEQIEKLVSFVLLMHKWNKAYNLTSVREPEQMLVKHIIDSIVVAPFLTQSQYIDVGTGPGLPGIPLAIMCPDKNFILLDSLGKRVRFMKQVAYELKLNNIQPVQSRVENFIPPVKIDGVISRAFASLKDMLHWCQHLVDSQGVFIALKGHYPADEIAAMGEKFSLVESIKLNVPDLVGERHIIKICKN